MAQLQADSTVSQPETLINAVNQIFASALQCETEEELAKTCLDVAERLTGSSFGWIGELNSAGRLDTIAISDPGWRACVVPKSNAVKLIKNMELRGIWGWVMEHGIPLLTNAPSDHPSWIGLPPDHFELHSFLGVPIKEGDKIVGMISLANKAGGYLQADSEALDPWLLQFVKH